MARVRYIVDDVEKAVAFYVSNLGFEIQGNFAPAIAILALGDLRAPLRIGELPEDIV